MSIPKMPLSWGSAELAKLCTKIGSGATPRGGQKAYVEQGTPLIRSMNIHFDRFKEEGLAFICDDAAEKLKNVEVHSGDVLLNITGASIGRVNVAPEKYHGARVNQHVAIIRPANGVCSNFIRYFLSTPSLQNSIHQAESGVTRQALTKEKIENFVVPLPPLNEQVRIAKKIDELWAQMETIKTRLDAIPVILARFRQSLLTEAVSGKLTEKWRELHKISKSEWKMETFDKLCRQITVGYVGKMKDQYRESGVPFLRSQNVRAFKFSSKNLLYISADFHKEIGKSRLEAGDLAIVRSGAPGTACVIPEGLGEANCSDLVIARPKPELNPHFACIFMNSEYGKSYVASNQVGVAQQHFNVRSMKKTSIELPSAGEQAEIVEKVDQLFAFSYQIEERVLEAKSRVNALTKSILAKAFCGDLVPQDPNDEPVSILLTKIKAETKSVKIAEKPKFKSQRAVINPKRKAAMTKSRFDSDIHHQPYLSTIIRESGQGQSADALFQKSQMTIEDFYKQLAWEVDNGYINGLESRLEAV